ncbi:MAG: 6-bladed beta-propeller [Bacteroidaceae bacterium]|nr:6-bladed beta-propeller [Bacteroidaceae bacterium]
MKNNINVVCIVSILFVLYSCDRINSSNTCSNVVQITANLKQTNISDSLRLSDIADSVSCICLKSDVGYLIGPIKDIRYESSRIYINQWAQQPLLVFNDNGDFLMQVGAIGRGPGEYLSVTGFDIHPITSQILIWDETSKKIIVYTPDGAYVRHFIVHDFPRDFAVLENGDIIFYDPLSEFSQYHRGVWKTDSLGVFKETLIPINHKYKLSGGLFPKFFRPLGNGKVGFMSGEDKDNIYWIDSDSVIAKFHINTDIKIPKSHTKQSDVEEIRPLKMYLKCNYFETDRLLLFTITDYYCSVSKDVIFDKKFNRTYYPTENGMIFDLPNALALFYCCNDGKLLGVLYPEDIIGDNFLSEQFPAIGSDSNPIIIVYHMKN